MLSKTNLLEDTPPFKSDLLNAIHYAVNRVAEKNLLRLVRDQKRHDRIHERGFSYSEISYLLNIQVNKSMDYGHLDRVKATLQQDMPVEYFAVQRTSKKKYAPSIMRRACESLATAGLFKTYGSGPWDRTYKLVKATPANHATNEDVLSNRVARRYARRVRLSVRNAKLEDAWSNGGITLFGLGDWERLPEESREKIMRKADRLANEFYEAWKKSNRVSEGDPPKVDAQDDFNFPVVVIDPNDIMKLPEAEIRELERVWKLKQEAKGKPPDA